MLLVETLLANESPDRTRLEPRSDWRRLSEGYMAELGRSFIMGADQITEEIFKNNKQTNKKNYWLDCEAAAPPGGDTQDLLLVRIATFCRAELFLTMASFCCCRRKTERKSDRKCRQTDRKSHRKCTRTASQRGCLTFCFILAQLARLSLQRLCMVTLQAEEQTHAHIWFCRTIVKIVPSIEDSIEDKSPQ